MIISFLIIFGIVAIGLLCRAMWLTIGPEDDDNDSKKI
jgi:hypothetical protein